MSTTALITGAGAADKSGEIKVERFTDNDLWASIGAAADEKQFEMRTLALTKPADYEAKRKAAMDKLKVSTASAFKATYDTYIAAGFGASEAKRLAVAAAKSSYDAGAKALRALFPSATDNIWQAKNTAPNVMMARAARSAPKRAKRKPAQKRR
jgi:hypothetical protein